MDKKEKFQFKLKNGLRVVVAPMPGLKSVTVLGLVKAGTRYELRETNGISHFLEHMVFKGTRDFLGPSDIALAVDQIGGRYNAFTDKEYTGFYVKSGVENIDIALNVVSQFIFHPTLPKSELEIERGVILEEIRMYEDEPQAKVGQEFEKVLYGGSALGWDTLGTEKNVSHLKREVFEEYLKYMYVPNRITLVVAGGVKDNKKLRKDIEANFGQERNQVKHKEREFKFEQKRPNTHVVEKTTQQCHMVMGYRTFGRGNKERYTLSVLSAILGQGMSSRLFTEIRAKRGLSYYVHSMVNMYAEEGYLAMRAGTKPGSIDEVVTLGREQFGRFVEEEVSSEELNKAKEFIKGHLFLGLENSFEVASFYGEDLLLEGKTRTISEVIKGIEGVKSADIKRLAKKYFVDSGLNLSVIGPKKAVSKLKL